VACRPVHRNLATAGDTLPVSAWAAGDLATEPLPVVDVVAAARERARALVATAGSTDEVAARLVLAADAFVTTAPDVVAATRGSGRGRATP
jgi:hypothetical protein